MSLAGKWSLAMEGEGAATSESPVGVRFDDTIRLPGTTAGQGKGAAEDFVPRMDKESMSRLRERHPFVGVAWYQREVTVPQDWQGKSIRLSLERVLWESCVWVDGVPVGERRDSLSVPHRFDLTDHLHPGKTNTLTLRIGALPPMTA
ncbi:MAG: sugar-binding domain-containing protein, partial [Planctomycetota bacterium]